MRHPYVDQTPSPAALFLPVVLHVSGQPDYASSLQGKIDTAADMVAIPRTFRDGRRLLSWGDRNVRQTGKTEKTYMVEVELDGLLYSVEAVLHDRSYVLIGRDILNQLILVADGPNEVFELQVPAPPQRRRVREQN